MLQFNEIPYSKLAALLAIALIIVIAQRLFKRYVIRFIKNERKQSSMSLYAPLVINIIWIIFFLFSIYELALINPIISISFSALILFIAWNNVKDFVQGTIFKLQQGNIIGQRIKVDAYSGVVIKMRNTTIDLQLENGETVQYPYSKLSKQVIGISTTVKYFKYCSLNISAPYTEEIETLKSQIVTHLYNIPWIVSSMSIKTEFIVRDSETIDIKIGAYTLDEKFIPKIQQALNKINF